VGEKIFTAPSQGGEEQEEETEDGRREVVPPIFSWHQRHGSFLGGP
jgi:hypothetical protein